MDFLPAFGPLIYSLGQVALVVGVTIGAYHISRAAYHISKFYAHKNWEIENGVQDSGMAAEIEAAVRRAVTEAQAEPARRATYTSNRIEIPDEDGYGVDEDGSPTRRRDRTA